MAGEAGEKARESWLLLSLRDREKEIRGWAERCRGAYRGQPMAGLAGRLAEIYDKAADVIAAEIAAEGKRAHGR